MSIALDSLLYLSQGLGDFSLAKMVVDIIISEVPKIKAKVNFSFKNIIPIMILTTASKVAKMEAEVEPMILIAFKRNSIDAIVEIIERPR